MSNAQSTGVVSWMRELATSVVGKYIAAVLTSATVAFGASYVGTTRALADHNGRIAAIETWKAVVEARHASEDEKRDQQIVLLSKLVDRMNSFGANQAKVMEKLRIAPANLEPLQ